VQVWHVSADGITCVHSKVLFGTVVALQKLRPKASETDLLFVGTDRFEYFTLAWNKSKQQLETVQTLHDQSEPFMTEEQSLNKCVVDSTGKFMVMHLWAGVINISRLIDRGEAKHVIKFLEQVRVSELFVKSSTFIYSQIGPRIAFLYRSRSDAEDAHLAIYKLTQDDRHTLASKFSQKDRVFLSPVPDKMASMLIPVPIAEEEKRHQFRNTSQRRAHLGGLLAVGETSILYLDTQDFVQLDCHLREGNIFIAWAEYDGTRYFLADDFGRLHLLTILIDGALVTGVDVRRLNGLGADGQDIKLSKASTLVHMGNGVLFLGSHHGDSQLLYVNVEGDPASAIRLIDAPPALSNNAPILDFVIMDLANRDGEPQAGSSFSSGQTRLVAGCGAEKDGSLRSIRSGVGLEDLGLLDQFNNVRGLFPLKSYASEKTDVLVVTTLFDTRIFKFTGDGSIEELMAFQGMVFDQETLLAANLPSGKLLQVTPDSVLVLDPESGVALDRWNAEETRKDEDEKDLDWKISKASENGTWLLLSLDGRKLVSLKLTDHLRIFSMSMRKDTAGAGGVNQISCVHASPINPDLGVVGFWKTQSVAILDMKTLQPLKSVKLPSTDDTAIVPRDVLLVQIFPHDVSGPTLLAALDDGNVVTCNVDVHDEQNIKVSGRRSVFLGTHEARLHLLPRGDGTSNVFVTTEHSSLIHCDQNRLLFSATTAEDATYVAPFDSEAYPNSIVVATDNHIRISEIDPERRTHVRSLKVNETVRRIAYSPSLKAFGLCCVQRDLVKGAEVFTTSFKLADEIVFQLLGKVHRFDCNEKVELPQCVVRASLLDCHGVSVERFLVGTTIEYAEKNRGDEPGGRIWVFGVDEKRNLFVVGSRDFKSGCLCLATMGKRIVVALRHSVRVYDYTEQSEREVSLKDLAKYPVTAFPIDIDVRGNVIAVADLMKSISLVEFTPPSKGGIKARLVETDRHFQSCWATSVRYIGDKTWLETEAGGHLLVVRQKEEGITEFDRSQMELISEFNLGEQVNCTRTLDVAPSEGSIIVPKAFLGTVRLLGPELFVDRMLT